MPKSYFNKDNVLLLVLFIGIVLLFWQPGIAVFILIIDAIAIAQSRKNKKKAPFQVEWLYQEIVDPSIRIDTDEKILALDDKVKLLETKK